MAAHRIVACIALAAASAASFHAQAQAADGGAWNRAASRAYLGLNAGGMQPRPACATAVLACPTSPALSLHSTQAFGASWGAEVGLIDLSRAWRGAGANRNQGLNLSLTGRAPLGASFGVFGRFGASYGFADTSPVAVPGMAAASDGALGLSFGAGVSYDFSPRLSATLGWDSHDFRLSGRDPVRATSVGLQYRY